MTELNIHPVSNVVREAVCRVCGEMLNRVILIKFN